MARTGNLVCAIGGGLLLAACSESPVAPKVPVETELVTVAGQPVLGTYEFHFLDPGTRQEVSSEPFGSAVLLQAHILGASGPVQSGIVVFQYCSRKGFPPNDINRIDEAPLEVCEAGDGTWANLGTRSVDAFGNAELEFCCPQVTPTIGFRYKYLAQGSGISNWTVTPRNFNWL
jgi:hypothetical protein